MKKKIIKFTALSILSLSLVFTSSPINTRTSSMEMENLTKYNTDEPILLRNKPIQIPKVVKNTKEQFRGTWVSTVYNLDFPSKKALTEEEYKAEYRKLLDNLHKLNLNSIIFQVRPKLDAFYKSELNPWSEYLTGVQGQDPGWDPLEWMIEETHNRGMEFHAWFNPYRVTTGKEDLSQLAPDNWARKNPQYVFKVDGKYYLNPGEPEVINYIRDSIMEVVENYHIDGVHFDDYFYPDKSIKDKNNWYSEEERISFNKYGKGFNSISDWRRNNVDRLVYTIHESIKSYNEENKKSVQFGISPFGIWGHIEHHPVGSKEGTGSLTNPGSPATYDNLFADTRKWVKEEWVDYIAPQIYWSFNTKAAPYGELVQWWADVVKDTKVHLYIGHASYKKADINNTNKDWENPEEIPNQLKFNSLYDEVKGSIFFSYRSLLENEEGPEASNKFIQILKNEYFNSPALLPAKPWLSHGEIESPTNLEVIEADNGTVLVWNDAIDNQSEYYIIYREEVEEDKNSEKEIIGKIRRVDEGTTFVFLDQKREGKDIYLFYNCHR